MDNQYGSWGMSMVHGETAWGMANEYGSWMMGVDPGYRLWFRMADVNRGC